MVESGLIDWVNENLKKLNIEDEVLFTYFLLFEIIIVYFYFFF